MKFIYSITLCLTLLVFACESKKETTAHEHDAAAKTETPAADTLKKSIPKEEHALINGTHFIVKYHAPSVRGRTIWGGLVPYGEVWVTGAHSATSLETNKDIAIKDTEIPAGKYAVFTIPGKEKWTIIINKNWDQHLTDEYDPKEDVVRLDVTPEKLSALQERLKYSLVPHGEGQAALTIRWENLKVTLPLNLE